MDAPSKKTRNRGLAGVSLLDGSTFAAVLAGLVTAAATKGSDWSVIAAICGSLVGALALGRVRNRRLNTELAEAKARQEEALKLAMASLRQLKEETARLEHAVRHEAEVKRITSVVRALPTTKEATNAPLEEAPESPGKPE